VGLWKKKNISGEIPSPKNNERKEITVISTGSLKKEKR